MSITHNRIEELKNTIRESTNLKNLDGKIRSELLSFGEEMKAKILLASPDGSRWEDPSDVFRFRKIFPKLQEPRPSLRQHGITFKDGIQNPRIIAGSGLTNDGTWSGGVEIVSTAPHAQVVIDGRKKPRNQVPKNAKTLFFFDFKKNQIKHRQETNSGTTEANRDIPIAINSLRSNFDKRFERFAKENFLKPIKTFFGVK